MGPVIWSFVTENMKNINSLAIFIQEIKRFTFKCPWKMRKEFIQGIEYI